MSALQNMASYHRKLLDIPLIGITGTNGKTTSKELINQVLSKKYQTFATSGNLNNHIGVPLSLLGIGKNDEIAVIEMGANHVGEIADLCKIAKPTLGMITNIGKAHLEGFGNFEGVIKAKSEMYDHLLESGVSLIALTTGKSGALLINKNNIVNSSLFDLPVADTIGAGDTFHGAMLGYLYNKNRIDREILDNLTKGQLRHIGDYANKAAGINCHRSGANPPTKLEMDKNWGIK